ncbi:MULTISPECIES: hypothetical protein [Mesorhizobium]|uniref:hypothetical protein n=1 Tax=Mesorhizobium TaxID=68287 RepID=UPI0007A93952|nr:MULTISPECIES: hypothetical protein [Mesorhizobium]AMX93674.1 hypothetical protein A4R28_11475 [Mesorhizobium ciceri]MDF3208368.1 hypothetical protein [Mesorhizobium sp. LMG15046]MDF3229061.1 hypothetical protein [Mesorhizobium sp. DSM 30133]RUU22174.1 hypothetical protein EOC84_03420 [Mesorhizobium sp. Primo-B]RUU37916.1 hypothetical protein EOC83_16795 [Mesorhizobium sp. Primo-A]
MIIGNRKELDTARETLRDQFDAIWLASDIIEAKEARAIRCSIKLDAPRHNHLAPNWRIFPGGRFVGGKDCGVIRA